MTNSPLKKEKFKDGLRGHIKKLVISIEAKHGKSFSKNERTQLKRKVYDAIHGEFAPRRKK